MGVDELDIVCGDDLSSQYVAALIWARATARRDDLAEPMEPVAKLRGIQRRLQAPGASLYTARRRARAEAFALVVPHGSVLELVYLAVDPAVWGGGTGTALLGHVAQQARALGFAAVELWVIEDNLRAVQVYERAGWRPTDEVKLSGSRRERRLVLLAGRRSPS